MNPNDRAVVGGSGKIPALFERGKIVAATGEMKPFQPVGELEIICASARDGAADAAAESSAMTTANSVPAGI